MQTYSLHDTGSVKLRAGDRPNPDKFSSLLTPIMCYPSSYRGKNKNPDPSSKDIQWENRKEEQRTDQEEEDSLEHNNDAPDQVTMEQMQELQRILTA